METIAFLGLLGLGYLAKPAEKDEGPTGVSEGFANTIPVKQLESKDVGRSLVGDLDVQFRLPSVGKMVPSQPRVERRFEGNTFDVGVYASKTVPTASEAVTGGPGVAGVQLRPDAKETATPRQAFVSPLTGVAYKDGEFKHNNMVPFYRGNLKQNLYEGANRQVLDYQTGSASEGYAKREQTPFFEPTKEPMGNPFGLEAVSNFMESRVNAPRNRANEIPVEPIRVGPGLNQGFTHIPSGGFQQQAGEEFMIERLPRVDDLRVASNPKLTYKQPVVPGAHFITTSGTAETVGEVAKYAPDRYYINEHGERNFVTTGSDLKATARATQVLKTTTRMDTTTEYAGPAVQAEGAATYTVAAAKAPLVKQHGPFGFRNADATSYFDKNTDAEENDYGKSGIEIRPNERYYTGERVHATNIAADQREGTLPQQDAVRPTRAEELVENYRVTGNFNAIGGGMAEKPTAYDPNDVARTTIKEQTIDNDWLGIMSPASQQPKLTVYDPDDVARTTIREQTEQDGRVGIAGAKEAYKLTVYDPDDIARVTGRNTLQQELNITPAVAFVGQEMNQGAARSMRQYAQRENVSKGRAPTNSSTKVFNGEDYVNLQYRKLVSDSINDRSPAKDRVAAETTGMDVLGVQRPRAVLKLDVSAERNRYDVVSSLEQNPYVIPLHAAAKVGAPRNTL
jgi:hypothetical protein